MSGIRDSGTEERGDTGIRVAMWSGPRTISTALMRSWDNRGDTIVSDEPFYPHYLSATGIAHPRRDEIISRGQTDWRKIVEWLIGPIPEGRRVFYQKHMAHHLLPGMAGDWLNVLRHGFLIRDPEEMLISLSRVMPEPRLEDTGLPQQLELFERMCEATRRMPPVIDARDVLEHPRRLLRRLCESLGVEFSARMLSWPSGTRATDGVWAPHWYASVEASTGFKPYRPPVMSLASHLQTLEKECRTYYDELYRHRLTS